MPHTEVKGRHKERVKDAKSNIAEDLHTKPLASDALDILFIAMNMISTNLDYLAIFEGFLVLFGARLALSRPIFGIFLWLKIPAYWSSSVRFFTAILCVSEKQEIGSDKWCLHPGK